MKDAIGKTVGLAVDRRGFLGIGAGIIATAIAPAALAVPAPIRNLSLLNLHTGERARVDYWLDGAFDGDALSTLDQVLRDHRSGEVLDMSRELYGALSILDQTLGGGQTFHVISGYRSPSSNAALRRSSNGVAKKSFHMRGMAVDIRVPGVPLKTLHRAARSLKVGGVGKYAKSNFVHFDVGPVRYW